MKRLMFVFILLIVLVGTLFSDSESRGGCPDVQGGTVEGVLSPEGYAILEVAYPCAFEGEPVLVASPRGSGSLWVLRFEANSLTGGVGSIAVRGEPGVRVAFSWIAMRGGGNW